MPSSQMYKGEFKRMGNNQMLACDRSNGEVRRFFSGPVNAEVTGVTLTSDGRTMFINIRHPGETAVDRSDPADSARYSNCPDYSRAAGRDRPRL